MYARGATPETVRPPAAVVAVALPAAMPATCVPCADCRVERLPAYFQVAPGGGKARATITFAVVNAVCPFGKPAGIV